MDKQAWKTEFRRQYERHEQELRQLFFALYPDAQTAYGSLEAILYRSWLARASTLRRIDRQRQENPTWYKGNDLLGMCLYVEQFAGTLNGVREKQDYLRDAHVNYLHQIGRAHV